ncbi:MAG: 2,3-cyclic 3-phosphodiesterase [Candidatus Diapherotrites archaeon]|nr:2,3-cyclic 3-phosphodiesterase [Candidatus Diapherotrites archaeon]MDN5367219.1 2,3-cyclic 3-phosphodiesterase [Candidatus Diapherotrites archaeon]
MRLFVGVPLPDEQREAVWRLIGSWQQSIKGIKYVERENLHITLKFMGEVPETRIPDIVGTLESVKTGLFRVHLSGVGAFPSVERPRVVWVGVKEGFNELVSVSKMIDDVLVAHGVPREMKPFHPHVTIGRVKRFSPEIVRKIREDASLDFGSFTFERFVLYSSTLTPSGPIYKEVESFEVEK